MPKDGNTTSNADGQAISNSAPPLSTSTGSSNAPTSTTTTTQGLNFGGFSLNSHSSLTPGTSDSLGSGGPSGLGFGTPAYDPDEMIRTLSKIGVRPPRPFNPKR